MNRIQYDLHAFLSALLISDAQHRIIERNFGIIGEMNDCTLTTERCRLRRLSRDDAQHVLSACQTPGFTDGMTWEPVQSIEETYLFTDEAILLWEKGEKFVWTIEEKDSGRVLPCGIFARWRV